jgi:hypothetical protein
METIDTGTNTVFSIHFGDVHAEWVIGSENGLMAFEKKSEGIELVQ